MEIKTHDIVKIAGIRNVQLLGKNQQDWVNHSLRSYPYGIKPRCRIIKKHIPIGIRGMHRNERALGHIHSAHITDVIKPEDVVDMIYLVNRYKKIYETLLQLKLTMETLSLKWGIIGSVAYEIVTNALMIKRSSDIDIIIRTPLDDNSCKSFLLQINSLPVRVDVLMEARFGGYNLREYADPQTSQVLLKTINGPKIIKKSELYNPVTLEKL